MKMNINEYQVVDDPDLVDIEWQIPPEIKRESDKLFFLCSNGKANAKERIERLIQQYPDIPPLRNYLISWYRANDRNKEASQVNDEVLKLFPDYVFAISQKIQDLVNEGKIEEAGALLRGKSDIEDFYPHRKSFHVSEFAVFYAGVIYYLAASYRFDEAQVKIELLEEAGIKESIIDNLHRVKMRYMFE